MGAVYRAVDETTGATVALKLLHRGLADDGSHRRRFEREFRAAQMVSSEHVVPILDFGDIDGRLFLVVEYIDGESLDVRMTRGPLGLDELLDITDGVAAGLDALHQHGVIHRDIKPSNVILRASDGAALVTDFGLAKAPDFSVITQAGQVIGTIDYLAPELIKGEAASPASDIYGLGCLAFECVSGTPPFASKSMLAVGFAHLQESPPDPCALRGDMPATLSAVLLMALDKDPMRRPRSAGAFAALLREAASAGAPRAT